jgi:uncharacterized glyoxalase superfamily protein PhnB
MRLHLWIYFAIAGSFALGMMVESVRASMGDKDETRVTGIGGVFFKAHDPRALAAWYRQHLGIAIEPAGNSPTAPAFHSFEWREKADAEKTGSTVFAIFSDKDKYFDPSHAPFMINFRVVNLDRIRAELKQEGVTVDDKIQDESYGRFGWVMDPEGNRIELWEPK